MVRKKTCSDKGGQEMSLTLNNNETEKRNPAAFETTRESRRNLNAVAKRKRPSAAAGSAQQNVNLSDGSDEVEQPDLAGADDQRQAAMVQAITAQVLSTLEARDKPKGRKKSKKKGDAYHQHQLYQVLTLMTVVAAAAVVIVTLILVQIMS
ncbi:uncharacterized protein LOC117321892 [Pecten maximus]|uniref:uncharacterized protein LOC117321892 n=1 Tax=Pecten maximus TaxID=6579 RepID=UPI0014590C3E|nr:uncharacterized protein LOC117321892 [Pecten maximus]XP_033732408.1 uncharacterized protein LOC117321892 [Pecten maximus]